ncbi:MAG: recombinase, partial [Pseudomonadota bacterium]
MLDRIIESENSTAITAYERRIAKLEKDKIVLAEKLENGTGQLRAFSEMFELAFTFLSNPWKIWTSERLEDKRTVLKLTFANKLAYHRNEGFRTPKTAIPFSMLGDISMGQLLLAER